MDGPLDIKVVYPGPTDLVDARDSSFLFGTVGTGQATLTINGLPVPVWPNGAWLAWLPLPADSVLEFRLVAHTVSDSASLLYTARRAAWFDPPGRPAWIDSLSMTPAGRVWWPAGEPLPVSVRAAPGATVRLILPGGRVVPLVPQPARREIPWGIRAFDRDTANLRSSTRSVRYVASMSQIRIGADLGDPLSPMDSVTSGCCSAGGSPPGRVIVEAAAQGDTARVRWPLRVTLLDSVPRLVEFNDDTMGTGATDSLTVGRARPGATYHWFFPTGTRAVATGRLGDDLRVRLSREQEAWVPAQDARPLPSGTPVLRGTVGSIRVTPLADRLVLRIPVTDRVPFRVEEGAGRLRLRLYNAVGDINWIQYGPHDPYLRAVTWLQAASDEVTIEVELTAGVWGYRTRWDRNDLLFEVRRPPTIDPAHPLRGRLIEVDPGHPPGGARGPTGYREAEANLAVAGILRDLLQAGGATVIMTRTTDAAVDLWPRVKLADTAGVELLVSIHNNALPDGVNPLTNNGTSVYFNHPRSIPLAQAIEAELVRRLGIRDLGTGRGDLALARPTWMPAVLCEGLFMTMPDQEAALRQPQGQRLYAQAVAAGIAAFLRDVATGPGPVVH